MTDREYKLCCVVCGASTAEGQADVQDALRTFSFGRGPNDMTIMAIVGACREHKDMPLPDLRRHFYREVFQAREYEHSGGLELRERDAAVSDA